MVSLKCLVTLKNFYCCRFITSKLLKWFSNLGEDNDEYLAVGDVVTISYNGDVEDGHPATLPVCYGITDVEHAE